MKTKEELNALKAEYENLEKKFSELSDEEIKEVTGGAAIGPRMQEIIKAQITDSVIKKTQNADSKSYEYPIYYDIEEETNNPKG